MSFFLKDPSSITDFSIDRFNGSVERGDSLFLYVARGDKGKRYLGVKKANLFERAMMKTGVYHISLSKVAKFVTENKGMFRAIDGEKYVKLADKMLRFSEKHNKDPYAFHAYMILTESSAL